MYGLIFSFVLGCFGPKAATETGVVETGVDTSSPITCIPEAAADRIASAIGLTLSAARFKGAAPELDFVFGLPPALADSSLYLHM